MCYTRREELIILDDILRIKSIKSTDFYKCDKVIFINRDRREETDVLNEIVITLQTVLQANNSILNFFNLERFDDHELFILKSTKMNVKLRNLDRHLLIYLNKKFNEQIDIEKIYMNDRYYVRRVLNQTSYRIRSLRHMHQTREELEIEYLNREYVAKVFSKSHTFFSYLLFIDDFEVHRNICRALKIFYLISVCLSYKKRRKIVNVFTLIVESHDVNLKNIVEVFDRTVRQLNRDQSIEINKENEIVCAFTMTFLSDMSQQANNEDFARHNANMTYRICLCSKNERDDLNYDIVENDRYH